MAMRLTAKRVAKLLKTEGRYGDGNGLYLQVAAPGKGSWLLRYQRHGRSRAMGLGSVADFSLAEARLRARAERQKLTDGVDPLEARHAERDRQMLEAARSMTFRQCAEAYYAAHADEWGNAKHRSQFISTMQTYVYPIIGALPVAAVDEPLVLRVLPPIWKTKTITAKRIRNRIAAVLDYAAAAKYRSGSNPARWEANLEFLLPKPDKIATVKHHEALPYSEVATFMAELRQIEGVAARALEFLILTAARTGEVIGATWRNEIDLNTKTWTISAARMKASKEHRVPLSDRAVDILRSLPREPDNDAVFIGVKAGSAISSIAMYRVLKRLRPNVVVHGFRSTFSTWAHETTAFAGAVIEQSLAHTVGNAVERAYKRSDLFDKRRKLMGAWAAYCDRSAKSGAVVPLRKAT
jgi:integrase